MQAQCVVIESGDRCGSKAEHEAIEGQMMGSAFGKCEGVVFVVASFAVAAVQVFQREHVLCGLQAGLAGGAHLARHGRDFR